ncbi:MAG: biopolymer transporter ExbD [Ignavibacteriaceae bacterium]|nr:biopolymer transporter ExbD [Ignavibacteriaceae bacterium]
MAKKARKIEELQIDMTPIIDCVFQLLIFFMVTTVFAVQSGLKVDLPQASTSDAPPEKDLSITISEKGELDLNGTMVTSENLEEQLRIQKDIFGSKILIIKADKKSLHGIVVNVMDAAKVVGIEQLAIATDEKEKKPGT